MPEVTAELIEGPHFMIDLSQDPLSVACGACGGGAWLRRENIADWVGIHAESCMADILVEELADDGEDA